MAGVNEKIGYDELLDSRVKQLREIDERLERIIGSKTEEDLRPWLRGLRNDLAEMVRAAEEESAAF